MNILDYIKTYKTDNDQPLEIYKTTNKFISFNLKNTKIMEESTPNVVVVFSTNEENVYIVFATSSTAFLENQIIPFFLRIYPKVSIPYLSSLQLRSILEKIPSEKEDNILIAKKVVTYARINEDIVIKGKTLKKLKESRTRESEVIYTLEPFSDAFNKAAENNAWIDKIIYDYFILDKKSGLYNTFHEAYLGRNGVFKVFTNFKFFISKVYPKIVELSGNTYSLYKDRQRLILKNGEETITEPKTLKIVYGHEVFSDVKENKKLINVMGELENASISVFHGNPYVHLGLVDYRDGSSYDIWVLSIKEILITPQLRSTVASLNRIINHIFEKFEEGIVEDFVVK